MDKRDIFDTTCHQQGFSHVFPSMEVIRYQLKFLLSIIQNLQKLNSIHDCIDIMLTQINNVNALCPRNLYEESLTVGKIVEMNSTDRIKDRVLGPRIVLFNKEGNMYCLLQDKYTCKDLYLILAWLFIDHYVIEFNYIQRNITFDIANGNYFPTGIPMPINSYEVAIRHLITGD